MAAFPALAGVNREGPSYGSSSAAFPALAGVNRVGPVFSCHRWPGAKAVPSVVFDNLLNWVVSSIFRTFV